MTAVIVAGFVTLIAPWVGLAVSFPAALLLAATMSSTDSASVFSILRSKKQGLNENLRPLLELESGSNDPMAYVLTIVLIGVLSGRRGGRERTDEYREIRDPDASRRFDGVCYRSDRRMDH